MKPATEIWLKIILALLFFICLADMPYGYFQLVRFAALGGFSLLAYNSNEQGQKAEAIIYVFLAILFQPLIKIALGRFLWNIVDVIIGTSLIISLLLKIKLPSHNKNVFSAHKSLDNKKTKSTAKHNDSN